MKKIFVFLLTILAIQFSLAMAGSRHTMEIDQTEESSINQEVIDFSNAYSIYYGYIKDLEHASKVWDEFKVELRPEIEERLIKEIIRQSITKIEVPIQSTDQSLRGEERSNNEDKFFELRHLGAELAKILVEEGEPYDTVLGFLIFQSHMIAQLMDIKGYQDFGRNVGKRPLMSQLHLDYPSNCKDSLILMGMGLYNKGKIAPIFKHIDVNHLDIFYTSYCRYEDDCELKRPCSYLLKPKSNFPSNELAYKEFMIKKDLPWKFTQSHSGPNFHIGEFTVRTTNPCNTIVALHGLIRFDDKGKSFVRNLYKDLQDRKIKDPKEMVQAIGNIGFWESNASSIARGIESVSEMFVESILRAYKLPSMFEMKDYSMWSRAIVSYNNIAFGNDLWETFEMKR